jgi:hypothetical protein
LWTTHISESQGFRFAWQTGRHHAVAVLLRMSHPHPPRKEKIIDMAHNSAFTGYLRHIETALKAGNATEHTHRPALKTLVESLREKVTATNEPQRIACGAPDFIVTRRDIPLGYIEAKDVGVDLDRAEESQQLKRYRASLNNLILTDYLDFRLFRSGESVQTVRLATPLRNGTLRHDADAEAQLGIMFQAFFDSISRALMTPASLRNAWLVWPSSSTN